MLMGVCNSSTRNNEPVNVDSFRLNRYAVTVMSAIEPSSIISTRMVYIPFFSCSLMKTMHL